ncbi:MAG: RNA polymerase sigma factor [Actinobacteria bacterium]|nr:RNA polymerase sigma factor [Actinomycetota bacterium]
MSLEAFDDVLAAAQAGAGWAFERLYEHLAPTVTGYLRLQGAREPDDVASETFLAVFRGLGSFEGTEQQFRSWVFTIAHRRLLDERRYWSRRPSTTELEPGTDVPTGETTEDDVVHKLRQEQVGELLADLPSTQRDVLLLRIVGGLTVDETADTIGKRPGAVKQLQRRGLLRVKQILAARGVTL